MTVDLAALRRFAVPAINRDADTVVRASTLLSLIEAVEALDEIANGFAETNDERSTEMQRVARAALAPFRVTA